MHLKGNSTPKQLLLLRKVYKKSFPSVLLFPHCEKQVDSCGQKSYLSLLPFFEVKQGTLQLALLMSQTRWASVCVNSVYAKLHTFLQETAL